MFSSPGPCSYKVLLPLWDPGHRCSARKNSHSLSSPSETGADLKVKSESDDEEESGLGLVVGMSFGVAIGAALDNIALYMMIGLTLGILVDARMGSGQNKG